MEVAEIESGRGRIKGHLGNLARGGCYVKTETPCPLGTALNVRITTSTQSTVQARARVVSSIPGKGMGLQFADLEAEQLRILDSWLDAAVETSWLEANRRRSQRIALAVKVQVMAPDGRGGELFKERTQTVSVSPRYGAMVVISTRVDKGQQFVLRNLRTEAEMECTAVYVSRATNDQYEVGLSFVMPNRAFWGVVFPPADWSMRHPDAKGS